jgi:hypothetical protein
MDLIREYHYDSENRSVDVSNDEIISFLRSKPEFIKYVTDGGRLIYRGNTKLQSNTSYKVSPSNYVRRSQNTDNYYTMMMDNLPQWKSYPKRSKSIICSLDIDRAKTYGGYNVHVVVPIKSINLGICPKWDIWDSFTELRRADYFNHDFETLVDAAFRIYGRNSHRLTNASDWNEYLTAFSIIDNVKEQLESGTAIRRSEWVLKYLAYDTPFYEFIQNIFDPEFNGFDVVNNYQSVDTFTMDHEVWTDSDCYLISFHNFYRFIGEAK